MLFHVASSVTRWSHFTLISPLAPEYMLCLQNGRFDNADRMFNRFGLMLPLPCFKPSTYKRAMCLLPKTGYQNVKRCKESLIGISFPFRLFLVVGVCVCVCGCVCVTVRTSFKYSFCPACCSRVLDVEVFHISILLHVLQNSDFLKFPYHILMCAII